MDIKEVNLKNFSSLAIGGIGTMALVTTLQDLVELCFFASRNAKKVIPVGEGTNTFFGNLSKDIILAKMFIKGISIEDKGDTVLLTAQAGERWDDVVLFSVNHHLWGIENLSLIPGTVGAAPVQNIGAYGVELKDVLTSISAFDTKTLNQVSITCKGCEFAYRDSLFKQERGRYVITQVTLQLLKTRKPILAYKPLDLLPKTAMLKEIRDEVVRVRTEKLPNYLVYPNAGSFFKNPMIEVSQAEELKIRYPLMPQISQGELIKIPAAWLIEHIAEAKGLRHGDVGTWPNQPLVVVNYGDATAEELLQFSEDIIKKIKQKTGIVLEREVNYVL